jgi:hypothetical protein
MPVRRRSSLSRNPVQRTQIWDKKMSGEIYATLLPELKKISIDKVASYQATHEYLIATVKQALSSFGTEAPLLQEYMWYAEKLWKFTQHYRSNALQTQADALYLWYLARGRNDLALRIIAQALGIKINPLENIVEKTLAPLLISVVKKDTIIADGSEQTLLEYVGRISAISGYIDLSNMASGDTVLIKSYVKLKEDGDYKLYYPETFTDAQSAPALYLLPRMSGFAFKITLQQTTGSYKSFDYLFVKGV